MSGLVAFRRSMEPEQMAALTGISPRAYSPLTINSSNSRGCWEGYSERQKRLDFESPSAMWTCCATDAGPTAARLRFWFLFILMRAWRPPCGALRSFTDGDRTVEVAPLGRKADRRSAFRAEKRRRSIGRGFGFQISSGFRYRRAISANGIPTSTTCANIWVAIASGFGGSGVPKRSGTTAQFIAK